MLYITRESLHINLTTAWLASNNTLLRWDTYPELLSLTLLNSSLAESTFQFNLIKVIVKMCTSYILSLLNNTPAVATTSVPQCTLLCAYTGARMWPKHRWLAFRLSSFYSICSFFTEWNLNLIVGKFAEITSGLGISSTMGCKHALLI